MSKKALKLVSALALAGLFITGCAFDCFVSICFIYRHLYLYFK